MNARTVSIAAFVWLAMCQLSVGPMFSQPQKFHPKPKWEALGELIEARERHSMAVGRKKLPHPRRPQTSFFRVVPFVFGGLAGPKCKDTVEYYDSAAKAWKSAAKMPAPRCGAVAVTAPSGLIYLIGGRSSGKTDAVDIYDPIADQWQPGPSLQKPLDNHGAVAMPNGSIYIFGGTADTSQNLKRAVYWLQEGGSSWKRIEDLPVENSSALALALNGYIYVFGDKGTSVFKPNAGSPKDGKWRHFQGISLWATQGAAVDGGIYLVQNDGNAFSSGLVRYEPSSDPLVNAGTLVRVDGPSKGLFSGMSATGLGGSLYLTGGYHKFDGYSSRADRLKFPQRIGPPGTSTTKEGPGITATLLPPIGGVWTEWLNRDLPSGSGDYETLKAFQALNKACAAPSRIQCRTVKGKQDWRDTGQQVTCTTKSGGVCVNRKNGGACRDYEVRFFCQ